MATVPSLRTWADGEVITAAMMNANFRDPATWLANTKPHGFARQLTNTTSVNDTTWTTIKWDFEDVDTDNSFTFSGVPALADHYEVNTAGYYLVTGHLNWNNSQTDGSRAARITKNGTIIPGAYESTLATTVATGLTVTVIISCAVGDDIALQGWHDNAANAAISTNLNYGFFRNETSYLDVAWFQSV